MADKLGPAKIEGTDTVVGKQVPAIYFGATKINNNFDLVDKVTQQAGGTATIFVKSGDEYVRVATNVKKDDGSRAIGTILDPKGKAIASIQKNGDRVHPEERSLLRRGGYPRQAIHSGIRANRGPLEERDWNLLRRLFELNPHRGIAGYLIVNSRTANRRFT
jgi:hypothetical protein